MADLVTGGVGEIVKYAIQTIKNGLAFRSTLQTSIETLKVVYSLLEKIKGSTSNDLLDRPRDEDIVRLETHIKGIEELVEKSKKLKRTWWKSVSFARYKVKLEKKDEDFQRHLAVHVQMMMFAKVTEILDILMNMKISSQFDGNQAKGLCGAPEAPHCMGMDELLTQLKIEMMNDGVFVRVLTGLGGSGKSTLAKKLCSESQIIGKFGGNIFFVTVSKTPDLKIIAQTLFEHCRHEVPKFRNDEDATNQLELLLKEVGRINPILLVLDDVWPGSESLVEKFEFEMPDYKILVTSRVAFRRFGTPCKLDPLDHDRAVSLFEHYAQLNDRHSSSSYMPDKNLVHQIVKGCKGSPLALQVIAGSLCQQPFEKWQNMMEFFQNKSILESNSYFPNNTTDTDLLCRLQQSLDSLEDINKKECFMDLGLFPDDQGIPVTVLIDMWAAMYNLDEDGIKAMAIVDDLNTRNLINVISTREVATERGMYYNNHYVMMHDLLRDLAIHQSKGESFEQRKRLIIDLNGGNRPDWWIRPNQHGILTRVVTGMLVKMKQQKVAARILSISTDETFSSDWCDIQPDEAEVLILNLRSDQYSLPDFTKKMSKLEVLIITNYGFHRSELTKFELLGFLSNLKRIRLEKVSVPCLCILKNLRKLSLHMCNTRNAFENCSIKISDVMPNLVELSIDYCKDLIKLPDGFCNISTMKKLSITNCRKLSALPHDIKNLENLEVLRLCSCSDLEEMPESVAGLNKLCFLDISDCVSLSKLPNHIGELQRLEKLSMKGCSELSVLPDSVIYFGNLKHEMQVICDEEGFSLWEQFPNIPNIRIYMPKVEINLNFLQRKRN